ncbi:integrase [Labrys sp. WJW]|uniref:tyrosine-type recombinase/integrase n=1 Tax=Labrys sp. WJW TaxID=1737983 RepID=UPI00082A4D1A|nr:tyrosine-type recombinase/integrase [Labrys sp. WJW]OCC05218.1 integrase [Labrys sp. WJW]
MRVQLKGINRSTKRLANGTSVTYWYAWRGGPRLTGEPGTPEFMASYQQACSERQQERSAGTLQSLVNAYQRSTDFLDRAPRTRADYIKQIKKIEAKFGTFPIAALPSPKTRGIFKDWRDELAATSRRQADYAWTVLALILAWAKDRGKCAANPCERGGRVYSAERNDKIWTDEIEKTFREAAPAHLHLALTLALWTGQRQGDLLRLTWSNYDGEWIRLRQSKTGTRVAIPVGAPLKEALDAEKARKRGALILLTAAGNKWTSDGFRTSWHKAAKKAGISGLTFHDLRGSAVTRLGIAGASVQEIATLTGLSLKDVQEMLDSHYLARDPTMAKNAVRKLETRTKSAN